MTPDNPSGEDPSETIRGSFPDLKISTEMLGEMYTLSQTTYCMRDTHTKQKYACRMVIGNIVFETMPEVFVGCKYCQCSRHGT